MPEYVITMVSDRVSYNLLDLAKIEMHELLYCLRLYQTTALLHEYRDQLHTKLNKLINGSVARDPEQWEGYRLRPVAVVKG